jgi:preprotein translocase SecE subunit
MAEIRSDRAAARRARRTERAASMRPQPQQRPAQEERKRSNFLVESIAELRKVEWPSQNQVVQGTAVVLIACIVVGAYLYGNDLIWKHFVSNVLLGQ